MKKIISQAGGGKTTELIRMSGETQNYIVCMNQKECSRISAIAHEMNIKIPFPISYDEFINRDYYGQGVKGVLIDNIEYFINRISDVPVNAITLCP